MLDCPIIWFCILLLLLVACALLVNQLWVVCFARANLVSLVKCLTSKILISWAPVTTEHCFNTTFYLPGQKPFEACFNSTSPFQLAHLSGWHKVFLLRMCFELAFSTYWFVDVSAGCSFKLTCISVFFLFLSAQLCKFLLVDFPKLIFPSDPIYFVCFAYQTLGLQRLLLSQFFPSVVCLANIEFTLCFCPSFFPQYFAHQTLGLHSAFAPMFSLSIACQTSGLCSAYVPVFACCFALSIIIYCTCLPVKLHVCTVLLPWPVFPPQYFACLFVVLSLQVAQ